MRKSVDSSTAMRWIYISPHFDDAVLSCGGAIHEQILQGIPVEIWTICAGDAPPGEISPLIQVIHFQWGTDSAEEAVRLRTAEDNAAAARLGADTCHFSIPDCIYRRTPQGELLYIEDIFGPRHPADKDLPGEISAVIEEELLQEDIIVCPLGIGGHVDHLIVREAVEGLHRPLRYYADIPYLLRHPESLPAAVADMQPESIPVSDAGLQAWQDAIAAYQTQIKILFETEAQMRQAIQEYWGQEKSIRLWQ